jgi:processive 1,2-diacylglycerol beta-glucosyltransferase
VKYFVESQPDCIIFTHFLASEVAANLKTKGLLRSRLLTVITDFRLHSWWLAPSTDVYIVASEDAKSDLIRWGEDPARAKILGIPVEPVFSKQLDRDTVIRDKGLKNNYFTILVIGGGFGVGPIEGIIKAIDEVDGAVQAVVVCGHNKALMKKLDDLKERLKVDVKILGFIDNVHEYMEISDVLISKSGGITVSESLAKRLPMIVISPILGQETRNSDFLVSNNAAYSIERLEDLKGLLEEMVKDPLKLEMMKRSIEGVRKPQACYDIAKFAIDACGWDVK